MGSMPVSRRSLLSGISAVALLPSKSAEAWLSKGTATVFRADQTALVQEGALYGGGYFMEITMSPDGLTRLATYDSGNGYMWNATRNRWDNIYSSSRVPAVYSNWGSLPGTAVVLVPAPTNSSTVYTITGGGHIWKSTDRCQSWVDTGRTVTVGSLTSPRGRGPRLSVDPANEDVVILIDYSGGVWRTLDGFRSSTGFRRHPQSGAVRLVVLFSIRLRVLWK